jgi:hypothetical protein
MIVRNWITEEEAQAALNVVPPGPSAYALFLQRFLEGTAPNRSSEAVAEWVESANRMVRTLEDGFVLNYLVQAPVIHSTSPEHVHGWQLPKTISRRESRPIRAALTSAHLRTYVDAWLDTGRNADGSESPGKRDLRKAPDALRELWDYLGNAPAALMPALDSSDFELTMSIAEPTAYSGAVRDFFESQTVGAKRLFVGIMASDWKRRLCKCRYQRCGRYFLHPNPREYYLRGTFCSREHSMRVTAEESMRTSRRIGTEILIKEAARKLCAWKIVGPHWQLDIKIKRRLAGELCSVISRKKLHGYREEVKLNWVTRHQIAIENSRVEFCR